jgi:hypothetical protein
LHYCTDDYHWYVRKTYGTYLKGEPIKDQDGKITGYKLPEGYSEDEYTISQTDGVISTKEGHRFPLDTPEYWSKLVRATDLTNFITDTEVEEKITEHLNGYATENYVQDQINGLDIDVDLSTINSKLITVDRIFLDRNDTDNQYLSITHSDTTPWEFIKQGYYQTSNGLGCLHYDSSNEKWYVRIGFRATVTAVAVTGEDGQTKYVLPDGYSEEIYALNEENQVIYKDTNMVVKDSESNWSPIILSKNIKNLHNDSLRTNAIKLNRFNKATDSNEITKDPSRYLTVTHSNCLPWDYVDNGTVLTGI